MSKKATVSENAGCHWTFWKNDDGTCSPDQLQSLFLQEIRNELIKLNRLLHCENFTNIPAILRLIRSNTAKPKRRKRKPV